MLDGLVGPLLVPARVVSAALEDLRSIAESVRVLVAVHEELTAIRAGVDGLNDRLAAMADVVERVGTTVVQVERSVAPLAGGLDDVGRGVGPLAGQLRAVEAAVDPLAGELAAVERGVAPLEGTLERVEQGVGPLALELAGVRKGIERLEADLQEVRQTVGPLQGTAERIGGLAERLPSRKRQGS